MRPFATKDDFSEALQVGFDAFTGKVPDAAKAVCAADDIMSYSAFLAVGGLKPPLGDGPLTATDAELAAVCKDCLEQINSRSSANAIPWEEILKNLPWRELAMAAAVLLKRYVPWLPIPFVPTPTPSPIEGP